MRFSHRPGCPLSWTDLRHLRIAFVGFDGETHVGEMVVHRDHAQDVAEVFEQLYEVRWPIRRMRLVDDYAGDDDRSMAANNTSGYNCRRVAGGDSWSAHAYGSAIDVNPLQNPYVTSTSIAPPAGRRFAGVDRAPTAPVPLGVIREADAVVRAFADIGWEWGGDWANAKDYQHFSATGG
jgi:D-alanyl-D-alanine carboxypeptidase